MTNEINSLSCMYFNCISAVMGDVIPLKLVKKQENPLIANRFIITLNHIF